MKLFITGACGFVGRELVRQCKQRGIDYAAVDLSLCDDQNYRQADIRSPDIVHLIPEGVDAIVHLAGLTRDQDCKDKAHSCFDANVMATLHLMGAAQKKSAKQFIFASSEWVYGDWIHDTVKDENTPIDISTLTSEYALSKLVSEANLRQKFKHGFCPVTILRFGIIYGNRPTNWAAVESIFNAVKTQDTVEIGSCRTARRFVHVSDIANGILKAVGHRGFDIINLEGDTLITLQDILDVSSAILEKRVSVIEKNKWAPNVRNVSNEKAKKEIGWKPIVTLHDGLSQLHAFLSARGA